MPARSEHDFDDDDEYRAEENENDGATDSHSSGEEREDEDAEEQTEEEPELRSNRQSRKRRAAVSPPSNPPAAKKRGRGRPKGSKNKPKAAPQDHEVVGKGTAKEKTLSKAKLNSMTELRRAQRAALTYDTPITFARMEAHVGPDVASFDASWTRADEHAIGYHESSEKRDICALEVDRNGRQSRLWKFCLSVCERSPFDILSPRRGVCYVPVHDNGSIAVWSQDFCQDLTEILSHRIWNGDINALIVVLQYTVICRTDDRRLWHVPPTRFRGSPTDLLRTELQASTAPLQTSIHELHKDIRNNRSPDIIHCQLSNLMMKIADVAASRARSGAYRYWDKTKKVQDGYDVYGVTVLDLGIISEAIARSTGISTKAAFDAYKKINPIPRDILNDRQFRGLVRRAWLHEKRLIDVDQGLNGRSGTPAPRFSVSLPALTESRRDDVEEIPHPVQLEIESEAEDTGSEVEDAGLEAELPDLRGNIDDEQGYVGGEDGFDVGGYTVDDWSEDVVQNGDNDSGDGPCIRGRGQNRDVAPHCGGPHHSFQVRTRHLSPVEDELEAKDDHVLLSDHGENPSVTGKTKATWMSQEEANAAVFCLGPLDAIR